MLSNPSVDVCLTGPSNPARMDPALEAFRRGPRFPEELAWMRRVGDAVYGRNSDLFRPTSVSPMRSDLRYAIRTLPVPHRHLCRYPRAGAGDRSRHRDVQRARRGALRPLPYPAPEKLVSLWMRFTGIGIPKDQNWVSAPEFMDLRQNAKAFAEIAAIAPGSLDIRVGDKPERVGTNVSASLFPLLEDQPVLGRAFLAAEEIPGRDTVAVISHGLWRRVFTSTQP